MNTKTIIVSGSRTIKEYRFVKETIESSPWFGNIDTVFVGDAKGVDALVVRWCKENGITYRIFRAEWSEYGKRAGPIRNKEMIFCGGQALVALWDGESKGTRSMITLAKEAGLPRHIRIYDYVDQKLEKRTKVKGIIKVMTDE